MNRYNYTMRNKSFPISLIILILLIAVVNGLANEFSWYWRIPWLDIPMHFLGGFWVGSVALWSFLDNTTSKIGRTITISISAALLAGILWEVFEFNIGALTLAPGQSSIIDTISDLSFDIIGGAVAGIYFLFKNHD